MSVFPPSLWEFSLSVYARPGMERLCLWLQDHRQMNVNVLLWALWLDEQQLPFCADLWRQGLSRSAPWQRWLVVPLRRVRRQLPKRRPWLGLRTRVQRWELMGERRQLQCLQSVSDGFDFTRGGGDKGTVEDRQSAGEQTANTGYLWHLAGAEEGICAELQQIMKDWRQAREEGPR